MYLSQAFLQFCKKVITSSTISSAILALQGIAHASSNNHVLYNRVAWHEGNLYYDLSNQKWQAVRINKDGWEIVDDAPILFRRYSHQRPQATPIKADKEKFLKILNFFNLKKGADEQVMLGYIATCLIEGIPHPIIIATGVHGSCKTTTFRLIKALIDPSALGTLTFHTEKKELVQQLHHHWISFFDNVSLLPQWHSDTLCRACTGEGFSTRELYSDDDDVIREYKVCVGINGINNPAYNADVLDRGIIFEHPGIHGVDRRIIKQLEEEFAASIPEILGALFTIVSDAMKLKDNIKIDYLPRMADFTLWAEACSIAMKYPDGSFVSAYFEKISEANTQTLNNHVIGYLIMEFIAQPDSDLSPISSPGGAWEGLTETLYKEISSLAQRLDINTNERSWPKDTAAFSRRIKEIIPNLKHVGITITQTHEKGTNKSYTIIKKEEKIALNTLSALEDGENKENKDILTTPDRISDNAQEQLSQGAIEQEVIEDVSSPIASPCTLCNKNPVRVKEVVCSECYSNMPDSPEKSESP